MSKRRRHSKKSKKTEHCPSEIKGLILIAMSIILLLSLLSFAYDCEQHNLLGLAGYTLGWILHACFGLGSYLICLFLLWAGWQHLFHEPIPSVKARRLAAATLIISVCILLSLVEDQFPQLKTHLSQIIYSHLWKQNMGYHLGGAPFFYLYNDMPACNLHRLLNATGVTFFFSLTAITSSFYLAKIHPSHLLALAMKGCKRVYAFYCRSKKTNQHLLRLVKLSLSTRQSEKHHDDEYLEIQPEKELSIRPSLSRKQKNEQQLIPQKERKSLIEAAADISLPQQRDKRPTARETIKTSKREAALQAQRVYNGDFTHFKMPSTGLMTPTETVDTSQLKKNLRRQAEVLEETLCSFGIQAKVGQINCGPTITSFEVHPSIGVKVQKIKSLENDIALNMEAKSIRIIAPIPGKAAIGIEVPNAQPQKVGFKEMLEVYQRYPRKFHIPILLGKAVNGDYVMNDLAKMPHCIIAGATGSGKSVCINTIVMSILMTARPDQIRLLMVDPKKVELSAYSKLPHMLAPVITEPQGACAALNWLVKEMENRYNLLRQVGVRNIDAFNRRKINKQFEESLEREIPTHLHYIVAIIDELADLMMISSNDIESPIARIAQMARAVGIHLVLATQRPSREVITGLIKANFPTRIAFKVASRINSQIILDEVGAESLLGNGDMLFLPPGTSHLIRAQGAFISDEDINKTIEHICNQAPPNYVITSFDDVDALDSQLILNSSKEPADSLYQQAYALVIKHNNASTTFLQRKLKIGYARAASLMDMLEEQEVISSADGGKSRKVLAETSENHLRNSG